VSLCERVGRWIDDTILTPIEQFFQDAHQQCTEARRWVEREIRTPIETWRQQQEQRCREQECNWWCLCCNKWFCWLVTVVVRVIEWVIQIVGEWLVELICNLVVEIVRVVVLAVVHVLKWIAEAVVCIFERLCSYLFLLVGLALIGLLVGVVTAVAATPSQTIPALIASALVAAGALLLTLFVCEPDRCRLLGVLTWALKWSIVLGAAIAIATLSAASGFIVVVYGGIVTALIWQLVDRACRIPGLFDAP
jgi:hypothetical protein